MKLVWSIRKGMRLRRYEKKILKLEGNTGGSSPSDMMKIVRSAMINSAQLKQLYQEFFEFCLEDQGVDMVFDELGMTFDDMNHIMWTLRTNGLGRWVKGHYAALSTLAYYEPFTYAACHHKDNGHIPLNAAHQILLYWENRLPQGALLEELGLL